MLSTNFLAFTLPEPPKKDAFNLGKSSDGRLKTKTTFFEAPEPSVSEATIGISNAQR
jgi:hypothetical protein